MKELFLIISSKYRRPVPSKFKGKLIEHFRGSKLKSTKYEPVASQKNCQNLRLLYLHLRNIY